MSIDRINRQSFINAYNSNSNKCVKNVTKAKTFDTIEIMKHCDLYNIESESTYKRRASTIRGWIEWILDLTRM